MGATCAGAIVPGWRCWPLVLLIGLGCLALLGMPYVPVFRLLTPWVWSVRELVKTAVFGIPLVALGYPLYVLGCMSAVAGCFAPAGAG